jgi:hypothetical protein
LRGLASSAASLHQQIVSTCDEAIHVFLAVRWIASRKPVIGRALAHNDCAGLGASRHPR